MKTDARWGKQPAARAASPAAASTRRRGDCRCGGHCARRILRWPTHRQSALCAGIAGRSTAGRGTHATSGGSAFATGNRRRFQGFQCSAAGAGPGLLLVCGTGSVAFGLERAGNTMRCGGWGAVCGDEGSGAWIGRRALSMVTAAADGREPATALTGALLTAAEADEASGSSRGPRRLRQRCSQRWHRWCSRLPTVETCAQTRSSRWPLRNW